MLGRNDEALDSFTSSSSRKMASFMDPGSIMDGLYPVRTPRGASGRHPRSSRGKPRSTAASPRPITGWDRTTRPSRNTTGRSRSMRRSQRLHRPRRCRVSLGDHDQALADYNEAIRLGPDFSRAYTSRGELLAAMGQDEQALADYDRAVQLDPGFAYALRCGGPALAARPERPGAGGFRRGDPPPSRRRRRIQGPGRSPGPDGPVPAGDRRPEQGHRARPEPGDRLSQSRGRVQQPGPVRAGDRRPEQGDQARPEERRGPHEHRAGLLHDRPVRPVDREPERGGAAGSRKRDRPPEPGKRLRPAGVQGAGRRRLRDGEQARPPPDRLLRRRGQAARGDGPAEPGDP